MGVVGFVAIQKFQRNPISLVHGFSYDTVEEDALWERYSITKDIEAKRELTKRYLPFAKGIAGKIRSSYRRDGIDLRDMQQAASVGLIQAIDGFDSTRGILFRSFASHRIKGAIFECIERNSELDAQFASIRELRRERLTSLKKNAARTARDVFLELSEVTVGLAISFMLEDSPMLLSEGQPRPYSSTSLSDLRESIHAAVNELAGNERLVVEYHYFHDLPFKAIAELLGVSAGRTSQIHSAAIARIIAWLAARNDAQ